MRSYGVKEAIIHMRVALTKKANSRVLLGRGLLELDRSILPEPFGLVIDR